MSPLQKFFILLEVQGFIGVGLFFTRRSEADSAVFLGLSPVRLIILAAWLVLLGGIGYVQWLSWSNPQQHEKLKSRTLQVLGQKYWSKSGGLAFGLVFSLSILIVIFSISGIASKLEMMPVIFRHLLPFLIWLGLGSLEWLVYLLLFRSQNLRNEKPEGMWFFWFYAFLVITIGASLFYAGFLFFRIEHRVAISAFRFTKFIAAMLVLLSACRTFALNQNQARKTFYQRLVIPVLVFLVFALIYKATAILAGNPNTPRGAYFDQLAYAFLDGRLYLENPSSTTDLTLFNGQWYVAFPPLAAILMVPLALIFGRVGFSTVSFTIIVGALNVALVYVMLRTMAERGWIWLKQKDWIWVCVLFGLGTIHWTTAVMGKVWYISRILALGCMLAAAVLTLLKRSGWWVGIACGLSILARPNMIFVWPLFLGFMLQIQQDEKGLSWRKTLGWGMANAIPILLAVLGLLYYNHMRFGDYFDFGYKTMNVGEQAAIIQQYGQFNWRFIPWNLSYMWLRLPHIKQSCGNLPFPDPQGFSMLLTTPAMVYMLKAFQKKWWVIGAWLAFGLQLLLLSMHTGKAFEFGYRFFLDLAIPVIVLIALGAGKKASWFFRGLTILGILVIVWGFFWAFSDYCNLFNIF